MTARARTVLKEASIVSGLALLLAVLHALFSLPLVDLMALY